MIAETARIVVRGKCIACESRDMQTVASGRYSEGPVHRYISEDPWGVSPLPFLGDLPWEFAKCRSCGQAFHTRILAPEWQETRFREWMSGEAIREFERKHGRDTPDVHFRRGIHNTAHLLRIESLTRCIRGGTAVRLLDFGCGWGHFLAAATVFGFTAVGVDRDAERQEEARKRGVLVVDSLAALEEQVSELFHAVTLFEVLEHVEEPLELLRALRACLAPGGVLVLEVPDCRGVNGINTRSDYLKIHPLEHINAFTPTTLRALASRAGYQLIAEVPAHVTTSRLRLLKAEAKTLLRRVFPTTSQYFTKR